MFLEICDQCETEDIEYRDNDEGALCIDCYDQLDEDEKKEWRKH